jgi:hypothetical protein
LRDTIEEALEVADAFQEHLADHVYDGGVTMIDEIAEREREVEDRREALKRILKEVKTHE